MFVIDGCLRWIALLLGRYRLDIATCMAVYMDIVRSVDVVSKAASSTRKNRSFKLDQDRLIKVVRNVLERYNLNPSLLRPVNEASNGSGGDTNRCQYAYVDSIGRVQMLTRSRFAVGVIQQAKTQREGFQLFRSYSVQGIDQKCIPPGPKPEACEVAQVFAATGAAKFFLPPCTIGNTAFFDEKFPQSHPITSIALDEALGIFGTDVQMSVLLNIGPGIPSEKDRLTLEEMSISPMRRLTRNFSWPASVRRLSIVENLWGCATEAQDDSLKQRSNLSCDSETALRLESQSRNDIRERLHEFYGESGAERYHHLGPDFSVDDSSLNDVQAMRTLRHRPHETQMAIEAEVEVVARQHWVGIVA